jgi:hypothetical protein
MEVEVNEPVTAEPVMFVKIFFFFGTFPSARSFTRCSSSLRLRFSEISLNIRSVAALVRMFDTSSGLACALPFFAMNASCMCL